MDHEVVTVIALIDGVFNTLVLLLILFLGIRRVP